MEKEKLETFDPFAATPPRLTLNSFSSFSKQARDRPGTATPPIRLSGAIPFGWEEAPGRPKQKPNQPAPGSVSASASGAGAGAGADADRRLGLPPRLSASAPSAKRGRRGAKTASPATVLDGHYLLIRKRLVSFSAGRPHLSFGRKDPKEMKMRWDASSERSSADTPNSSASSSSSSSSFKSLSSVSVCSYSNVGEESDVEEVEVEVEETGKEEAKVGDQGKEYERKVLMRKRKGSVTCVTTYSPSHFWGSILGRLKQAVVLPCLRDPKI